MSTAKLGVTLSVLTVSLVFFWVHRIPAIDNNFQFHLQSTQLAFPIASSSVTDKQVDHHCGKAWPLHGNWSYQGESSHWNYTTQGCNGSQIELSRLHECFRERTFFILGNSISRQFAFELPRLLFDEPVVARIDQKGMCSKVGNVPESCNVDLPRINTTARHSWFTYLDGKPVGPPKPDGWVPSWDSDTCEGFHPDDCFHLLVQNNTADDVLIFNVGLQYCHTDPTGVENVMEWREILMRRFIDRVRRYFRGTVIYMNITPIQSSSEILDLPFRYVEERAERFNEEFIRIILAHAPEWYIFDAFSMCKPVLYTPLFNDHVHFQGHLTRVGWNIMAHMICSRRQLL